METEFETIDKDGKPPESRVLDAKSLNAIVQRLLTDDDTSAKARVNVQRTLDGDPPFDPAMLSASGQEDRCNLNFGDAKARVKSEAAGYYDLTDSVPVLANITTDYGQDATERTNWSAIISEEFNRLLKEWKQFDMRHQLLVQKFVSHGVGFLYFKDDVDWRWEVAGLDEFKVDRGVELSEDEVDVAAAFKDVSVSMLWSWVKDVDATDKRWDLKEVRKAIMNAHDGTAPGATGDWEKVQEQFKNNDLFMTATAKSQVRLAHVWVKEYTGRISQYLTLRDGTNDNYLFKCHSRFDNANQCYTFFPYEVGTNGTLHSSRGLAHEVYPQVQVLNTLQCDAVDNARLGGRLLLKPKTQMDSQDMAIMFFAGAAYIPPDADVQTGTLGNPSATMLPVVNMMKAGIRSNTADVPSNSPETNRDKTKFEVQNDVAKESVLPTANMSLFYQPWKRHLNEVWRRVKRKGVQKADPGAEGIMEFRKRCKKRLVPDEAIEEAYCLEPMRAMGYGSPSSRLAAMDEFMQYYGSLDPQGQNNLLRDRFAQKVGYAQVDRYVQVMTAAGRQPVDVEIAELQNAIMTVGTKMSVMPNDNHIVHIQQHIPSLEQDLEMLESGQGSPQLLQSAQLKQQHISAHMQLLKPDKLNQKIVAELTRQFNNLSERVQAATEHAQIEEQKNPQGQPNPKAQEAEELHQLKMRHMQEEHTLKLQLEAQEAEQKRSIEDADGAARIRAEEVRTRFAQQPPASVPVPA